MKRRPTWPRAQNKPTAGESRKWGVTRSEPHQEFCKSPWSLLRPEKPLPQQLPRALSSARRCLPRRVWEGKCTNALMNGMCVLQEAKLAALASKRWEHQPKEQRVQTKASRPHGPGSSAEFWSRGPTGVGGLAPHPEGKGLGRSDQQRECVHREPSSADIARGKVLGKRHLLTHHVGLP